MMGSLSVSQSKRARFLSRAQIPTLVLFLAAIVLVMRVPFTRGSLSSDAMDDSKVQRRYETSEGSPKIAASADGLSEVATRPSEIPIRTDETVLHDVSQISGVQPSFEVDTLAQDITPDQYESEPLLPAGQLENLEREDVRKTDSERLVGRDAPQTDSEDDQTEDATEMQRTAARASQVSDAKPSVQIDTLAQDPTPDQNESPRLSPGRPPESLERDDAEKADSEQLVGPIDRGAANGPGRPTGARRPSVTPEFPENTGRAVLSQAPRTDSQGDQMLAETEDATAPVPMIRRSAQLSDTAQPQGLRIHNPTSSPFSVGFLADGKTYRLHPGQHVELAGKNSWSVVFHRGGELGNSRMTLSAGNYSFAVTAKGWTLNAVPTVDNPQSREEGF